MSLLSGHGLAVLLASISIDQKVSGEVASSGNVNDIPMTARASTLFSDDCIAKLRCRFPNSRGRLCCKLYSEREEIKVSLLKIDSATSEAKIRLEAS